MKYIMVLGMIEHDFKEGAECNPTRHQAPRRSAIATRFLGEAGPGDSANQCEYRQNRQGLARVADETGGEISNDNDGQEDRPYEPEHPQA